MRLADDDDPVPDDPSLEVDVETLLREWFAMLGPLGDATTERIDIEGVIAAGLALRGDTRVASVPGESLELLGTSILDARSESFRRLEADLRANERFLATLEAVQVYFDRDAAREVAPEALLARRVGLLRRLCRVCARPFAEHVKRLQHRDRMRWWRTRRRERVTDQLVLRRDHMEVPPDVRAVLMETARNVVAKLRSRSKPAEVEALKVTLTLRTGGRCGVAARRYRLSPAAVSRVRSRLGDLMTKESKGIGAEWHDPLLREIHQTLLTS
jgi:hypothetical protein